MDCPRPEAPQQQQEEAAAPARPVVVVSAILGVSVVLTLGLLLTLALTHVRSAALSYGLVQHQGCYMDVASEVETAIK